VLSEIRKIGDGNFAVTYTAQMTMRVGRREERVAVVVKVPRHWVSGAVFFLLIFLTFDL
jgi:hypothetical protein